MLACEPFLKAHNGIGAKHREDEQPPDNDALCLRWIVGQGKGISEHTNDKQGDNYTGQRAPPAKDADATKQHNRDYVELESECVVCASARKPRGEDDASQPGDES